MTPPSLAQAARPQLGPWPRAWTVLLLVCTVTVGLAEAVLLELGSSYFTSGYNAAYVDSPLMLAAFFLAGAILDAFMMLGLWALLIPTLGRLRLSPLQLFLIVGLATLALAPSIDFVGHQVHLVLGDMVKLDLLWDTSAGSSAEWVDQALPHVVPYGLIAAAAAMGVALSLSAARRLETRIHDAERRLAPPPTGTVALLCALCGIAGTAILSAGTPQAETLQFGLVRKPSAMFLTQAVQTISDVDRDGYGIFSKPADANPFDADLHPYALEIPGNGIDENGMAGDLPLDAEPLRAVSWGEVRNRRSPHFMLVLLESFREDLIGEQVNGRPVTPFLERLAQEGSRTRQAYVHSPYTIGGRGQLFSGRIVPGLSETTLIDEFKERGYFTAHFSGQDDSYGNGEKLLGTDRADLFRDARNDIERRAYRSTRSVSLQIPGELVVANVRAFLEAYDRGQPLFLYVNIVDTHFPYYYEGLDDILGIDPLPRRRIRSSRASRVRETYANAAANVDRDLRELVEAFWTRFGREDTAILVTADHGQSIYDTGFLGHGQSLDARQTRVPFVLWGIGGSWPEPLALSDVRGLLRKNLGAGASGESARARFEPDPDRPIFLYMSTIDRPRLIGRRTLEGAVVYDLGNDSIELLGPDDEPVTSSESDRSRAQRQLVHTWEALRFATEQERAGRAPSAP